MYAASSAPKASVFCASSLALSMGSRAVTAEDRCQCQQCGLNIVHGNCFPHRRIVKLGMACTTLTRQSRTLPTAPVVAAHNGRAIRSRLAPKQPLRVQAASSTGSLDTAAPLSTVLRAAETKDVPPEQVVAALEQLEAEHAKSSLVEGFPAALDGTWRLVFASPGPPVIKAWQYIPVIEDAVIDVKAGTISLVGVLGPLRNSFSGKCRFESDPATGAYNMVFGWSSLETTLFSWRSVRELTFKEKTYSFFTLQGDLALSNSSATGGKTLMYRVGGQ